MKMLELSIYTVLGKETPYKIHLAGKGNVVAVGIDQDFAGRTVDEELPLQSFEKLLGSEVYKNNDALGFTLETDGLNITGLVGIGSGNERFQLNRDEFEKVVHALQTAE